MRAKYIVALQAKGNAVCLSPAHSIIDETERDNGNQNSPEIFRAYGGEGKREQGSGKRETKRPQRKSQHSA
jgi:hypothetical protein